MTHKLSCGTKIAELSQLSDAHSGVPDSISSYRARQLEKHLKTCSECRSALRYLKQVASYTKTTHTQAENAEAEDTGWLQKMLSTLVLETKPGRSIPLKTDYPNSTLSESEGAVRALIRSYVSTPQVLVLSTKLHGEITKQNAPCIVETHLQVALHHSIPELAESTRQKIWQLLKKHTDLNIQAVNLFIDDVAEEELLRELQDA